MRQSVLSYFRSRGAHAVAVETVTPPGFPDVSVAGCYKASTYDALVELKHLDAAPVRATTAVKFPHFTDLQRVFLLQRWRAGGLSWLLARVEDDWFLFDGETAGASRAVGGTMTTSELRAAARRWWRGREVPEELEGAIAYR